MAAMLEAQCKENDNMMDTLCNWTVGKGGQMILGTTLFLIGIHQFNILPFFSRDNFGDMDLFMGVTPLKALGAVATVGGLCLLGACCFSGSNTGELAE